MSPAPMGSLFAKCCCCCKKKKEEEDGEEEELEDKDAKRIYDTTLIGWDEHGNLRYGMHLRYSPHSIVTVCVWLLNQLNTPRRNVLYLTHLNPEYKGKD